MGDFDVPKKKRGDMAKKFFNPEKCPERVMQFFCDGPGMLALYRAGTESGPTQIHCEDYEGKVHTFFVPPQILGGRRSLINNSAHTLTKVSRKEDEAPTLWLMSCVYSRLGYLFPLDAFNDAGEYQPLKAAVTA